MLLTLSKPPKSEFEYKIHDYSPPFSSASARFSPKLNGGPVSFLPASASSTMGTPHRGLPPPSAMTLPDPGRGPPPHQSSMGSLPPAPSQWQGAEDGMKNWLMAKAEEDRRRQEEEKTRQEGLRLEQRKIEQSMLRESMQGGVPPHLVPMIFAGIGGGGLANMTTEWVQQYSAQLQSSQQQQQQQQAQTQSQLSPELRRETRLIGQGQPGVYGGAPQTPQTVLPPTSVLPNQPLQQPQHGAFSSSSYTGGNLSPRARAAQASGHVGAPTSAPRPPPQSQLPRLTTNEMHIQQPPTAPSNVQQLQQSQSTQQDQSSPSIYFHHWVPPSSQQEKSSSGNPPATPSGKYKASPSFPPRQRAVSHASDPDYTSSPKKRKAQGQHPAQPPPTSAPQSYTSPSFSHVSTSSTSTPGRRGHARGRSDASTRGPESHSGILSRRGTLSGYGHGEVSSQQGDVSEQQRYQQPMRGAEEHHQHQQQYQQHEQTHPAPQQHSGRGNGQGRAGTPMSVQAETRQSAAHQPTGGSVPTSPKREAGAQ